MKAATAEIAPNKRERMALMIAWRFRSPMLLPLPDSVPEGRLN